MIFFNIFIILVSLLLSLIVTLLLPVLIYCQCENGSYLCIHYHHYHQSILLPSFPFLLKTKNSPVWRTSYLVRREAAVQRHEREQHDQAEDVRDEGSALDRECVAHVAGVHAHVL